MFAETNCPLCVKLKVQYTKLLKLDKLYVEQVLFTTTLLLILLHIMQERCALPVIITMTLWQHMHLEK